VTPTNFTRKRIEVKQPNGNVLEFWFDGNSKITRENGTFADPVANSFSLPHVDTCPFATQTCLRTCYVHGLKANNPELYQCYVTNQQSLAKMLEDKSVRWLGAQIFASYIRANAPKGFRWHVSGDIFSLSHARFIAEVCWLATGVPFWIYTRSFSFIEPLVKPQSRNLVVNLSADQDNWQEALAAHNRYGLRLCYLTVDGTMPELPRGSVIFPDYSLRGRELDDPTSAPWWQSLNPQQRRMVCPPDFFGQSENYRCGPCTKCLKPWR
jgi:hypothetical protein